MLPCHRSRRCFAISPPYCFCPLCQTDRERARTCCTRRADRFDGKVDAVGASDSAPVTDAELEEAHRLIKDHLNMRFGTFHKAFLTLDEDHSGSLTVTHPRTTSL